MKSNTVTIKDIAKKLNISPSTVSRALKDHPDISKDTKKLIKDLAKELNYQPNPIALSLKNQRTRTIGVIIPEIVHYFFSTVISGIEDVAYDAGYNVIVSQTNESVERERRIVQGLLSNRIDGLIVSIAKEANDYAHLKELEEDGFPLVFFDRVVDGLDVHKIDVEDYQGAFKVTNHLIVTGCKDILYLTCPDHLVIGKLRKKGYTDALLKSGLNVSNENIFVCDSRESAYHCVRALLEMGRTFDGIFAVNAETAVGAILALKEKNVAIPERVAIACFGDAPVNTIVEPNLTCAYQPGYEMGTLAATTLIDLVEGRTVPEKVTTLKTELVIRQSSKKLIDQD